MIHRPTAFSQARIPQSVQQLGYGLDSLRFDSNGEERGFSLLHNVQTGSGAHPAFCSMGYGGYFPRDKVAGE